VAAAHDAPAEAAAPESRVADAAAAVGRALGRTVAAVAARTPWIGSSSDAVSLLETEHRRMEELLDACASTEAGNAQQRRDLFQTIVSELKAHELIEEKVFYPELKTHADAREIVLEGYEEHHVADLLVDELTSLSPADERWMAKFTVLKENIEHHIEEEEDQMFPTARRVLSREELEDLGARMRAMKATTLQA
jgi:hemerythrin-like domain-containing protein